MGSNSSRIGDLPKMNTWKSYQARNLSLRMTRSGISFSRFLSLHQLAVLSWNSLEEATISVCRSLVENNPRTGNLGALIKVFLSRTKELKLSAECQNHIFIWQTHNALFIICCLLKVFICQMSEEELQLHFTYEENLLAITVLTQKIFWKNCCAVWCS